MLNRRIFETVQELREYENYLFHTRQFGPRTPRPVVSPYGPHYRMHPELSRPAYGIIVARSTPYLSTTALPAYVAISATEAFPEVSGPMYQSAMSGQPSIGVDLGTLQQTSGSSRGFKWHELGYWRGY